MSQTTEPRSTPNPEDLEQAMTTFAVVGWVLVIAAAFVFALFILAAIAEHLEDRSERSR